MPIASSKQTNKKVTAPQKEIRWTAMLKTTQFYSI
ncbi:hypothetical protein SKA34_15833 [Photobacterium sp. SKA34]|nr:hypothetical protein SKA34_15833 [Photobacterium sp. SKA34]